MPRYTFRLESADDEEPQTDSQALENDEVAVHVARRMMGPRHRSIRVGREAGHAVEWLGAWDLREREVAWRSEG